VTRPPALRRELLALEAEDLRLRARLREIVAAVGLEPLAGQM
jgi:hypothetical protein